MISNKIIIPSPGERIEKKKQLALQEIENKKQAEFKAAMSQDEYKTYIYNEVKKDYPGAQQSESGLVCIIENKGDSMLPVKGSKLSVHYKGTFLSSGDKFDSSYDRGQPIDFAYLVQRMVPGFEEGMGMIGKGGKAKLIIPSYAAYGAKGKPGAIPPYSDLVFEIEMVDVQAPEPESHEGHNHKEGEVHDH